MERLAPKIKEMAKRIEDAEKRRRHLAGILREGSSRLGLFHRAEQKPLEGIRIVGVDGGMSKKSLHGIDCVLVRSCGACFKYQGNRIESVEYFPSRMPPVQAEITDSMSDIDWAYFTSIVRQSSEINTAISCVEKFRPSVLLMDGSIVPHHSDRPSRLSPAFQAYKNMITEYHRLYEKCLSAGTMLAGVVEDSRGTRFCDILNRSFSSLFSGSDQATLDTLCRTRDTNLLFWALKKGERTMHFSYCEEPREHPVLRDFEERHTGRVNSLYLKTAEWDRPVRVDYLKDREGFEGEIASVLLSISGHHSSYGFPAPLIEADSVARLSDGEMENFYFQILAFAGNLPSIMRLRRDSRPF
jgi:hypothetical protein